MNTYSNGYGPVRPISAADVLAAADAVEQLGPPPPSDITVAPDILAALRDLAPPSGVRRVSAAPPAPFGRLDALRVHVDELLPAGCWHTGPPGRSF